MYEHDLNEDELLQFFSSLADRMEIAANYEKRIARFDPPQFNVFDYVEPDENKMTTILKDLLDPNGSHAQGEIFLQSFVRWIGFDRPSPEEITNAVVRRESPTETNRRIDLTIRMGPHTIGLENKIYAGEQPRQISDYMDYLQSQSLKSNGSWLLVFLTPEGRKPTECDADKWEDACKKNTALPLSYCELSSWLRSCRGAASSDRVRGFISDMAEWTEHLRGGNGAGDLRTQMILDFIRKHPQYLETLLAVDDTADTVRKGLAGDFAKTLEQELRKTFPQPDWTVTAKTGQNEPDASPPGIRVRKQSWPANCHIGLEPDKFGKPYGYGIFWLEAPPSCREKLKSVLNELVEGTATLAWPWYHDVPEFDGIQVKQWNASKTIALMGNERSGLIGHFVKLLTDVRDKASGVLEQCSS